MFRSVFDVYAIKNSEVKGMLQQMPNPIIQSDWLQNSTDS